MVKLRDTKLDEPVSGFTLKHAVLLALNYFVGHQVIYPIIVTVIVKLINPQATTIPISAMAIWYGWTLISTLWLARPLLADATRHLKGHFSETCGIPWKIFPIMYVSSIGMSLLISIITQQTTSNNQQGLNELLGEAPVFTVLLAIVFAPIVEELVFRGAFYRYFRNQRSFWFPLILSSSLFSLIHLSTAIAQQQWMDLWYFPLYAMLGGFIAYAYEKTGNIYGSILLHFIHNTVGMLLALLITR